MYVCWMARSQAAAVFRCRLWARPKPISWCSRNLRRSYDSTSVSWLASTRRLTAWTPATSTHSPSGTLAAIWVQTNIYCVYWRTNHMCANLLLSYQHVREIQSIIPTACFHEYKHVHSLGMTCIFVMMLLIMPDELMSEFTFIFFVCSGFELPIRGQSSAAQQSKVLL